MGAGWTTHRYHVRDLASCDRRRALSGHRAGRRHLPSIRASGGAPSTVVHASVSEDQSLCWSPNGRWIAFHSHKDAVRRHLAAPGRRRRRRPGASAFSAAARKPAGRDGRPMAAGFCSMARPDDASLRQWHVIGVDQESGTARRQRPRAIAVRGVRRRGEPRRMAARQRTTWRCSAKEAPGPSRHLHRLPRRRRRRRSFTVSRPSMTPRVWRCRPTAATSAFIAPAPDGFFQVFRLPLAGGAPAAVTTDPSHKTQPAWSPDGRQIAFTVWSYESQFWRRQ